MRKPRPATTAFGPWLATYLAAAVALPMATAASTAPQDAEATANIAATSYANISEVRTTHIALDLAVDFTKSQITGSATLTLKRLDPAVNQAILDTQDLDIRRVEISADGKTWSRAQYSIGKGDPVLGAPLTVDLAPDTTYLRIKYVTSPQASGVQWLTPAQTLGKKKPYLFTQSEMIHGRSWIPMQDTPSVRATYEARVRVPRGLRAVMSAEMASQPDASGVWVFRMPQPIPSYLISLAVGDIHFKATGPRTGVYTEPGLLKQAAYEFGETERTLELMEQAFGPYRWGRYDILVMPPSFPYGGMENPRLTFATPSAITGDRMLVSLVSHELAHSWSGNLVTNASWNDFWLNEGVTEYITYRLLDMQFGKARGDMERVLGVTRIKEATGHLEPIDWSLVRKSPAKDPDAVISAVPYERGALFLTWLETRFGRPAFDAFLRRWFDDHAFKSATTAQFLAALHDQLMSQQPGKVSEDELDAWVNQPELPAFAVLPHSDALDRVDQERDAWLAGGLPLDQLPAKQWNVHEWRHFFDEMPDTAALDQIKSLDTRFQLSASPNAFLASAWFKVAIAHGDDAVLPDARRYLTRIGTYSLIRPVYRELVKTESGKAFAEKAYAEAKPGYNPITQYEIERALNGESGG